MATQPEDGSEPSTTGNAATMHFFRPNDGIYVSEGPEQRTICVSPHLPAAMARHGDWHVEQFELIKELYRGKTSLLYMATDRVSGVQVALKLYRKRKLSVLNRYQVEREVRLHINLHHENIIHLYAAFEDEKHVYMVQEYAVCGDLFEDLKKGGGQMKEKVAVRDVVVPFLSALAYLHNQGIIHRDIKPENILLGAGKVVKVADFGLSINIHHERPVTRAGTLDYMAPEVLVCPDKRRPEENKDKVLLGYTAQVDSWAVGILAYELLVGYPPFEQESRAATYEHIMYKEPKYPSWMTEDARRFIGLALCKNASQRPTVNDLMQHSWVQPYMARHLLPGGGASSSTAPGPSRLRNSVSHASHASDASGVREISSVTSSMNGMIPAPPASAATGGGGAGGGGAAASASGIAQTGGATGVGMGVGAGGRMFLPVSSSPASGAAAAAAGGSSHHDHTPQQLRQQQQQLLSPASTSSAASGGSGATMTTPSTSSLMSTTSTATANATAAAAMENGGAHAVRHPHHHHHHSPHGSFSVTAATAVASSNSSTCSPAVSSHRSAPGLQPSPPALKTSVSLQAHLAQGSHNDHITGVGGEGGRLHDSISDPTARAFELQNPHPPGAAAAASLYGGPSGSSRSGGGGTVEAERTASHTLTSSTSGGGAAAPGTRQSQVLAGGSNGVAAGPGGGGGSSLSFTSRLAAAASQPPHPAQHLSPTISSSYRSAGPPQPLALLDPLGEAGGVPSSDLSAGGASSGDYMSLSPCSHLPTRAGSALGGTRPVGQHQVMLMSTSGVAASSSASAMPSPTSAPVRHRMASMIVPSVNTAGAAAAAAGGRLPAPPISPKPLQELAAAGYHRPASGVLSDDSFLVPAARTPSISMGAQLLSPLQAQLLAPRPSSRLNSPSHSRRNSVSQAGMQPAQQTAGGMMAGGATVHGPYPTATISQQHAQFLSQHISTPLPQLSADYGPYGDIGPPGMYEDGGALRASTSFRAGGGGGCSTPGAANGAANCGGGGGGAGAASGKLFAHKMWAREPGHSVSGVSAAGGAGMVSCGGDANMMEGPVGPSSSFAARNGGGGGGGPVMLTSPGLRGVGGGGAGPSSGGGSGPGSAGPRVRMMTPPPQLPSPPPPHSHREDDMRPLMRESSISSSFKSSGGGSLRDDMLQQSLTVYHRPGKIPGVGRAALAARDADTAEAAASLAAGGGGGSGGAGSLAKAKSLVNRNLNGALAEDGGGASVVRFGSDVALGARGAAPGVGAAGAGSSGGGGGAGSGVGGGHHATPSVAAQRSFTTANSAFARKLAGGAIATKVSEYVRGRMPHDEEMAD